MEKVKKKTKIAIKTVKDKKKYLLDEIKKLSWVMGEKKTEYRSELYDR